ncbi:MAG: carboxylesterase [Gammaproteobacteria bacterium]|nr:carboxylesterase [Gammaproteobacteria bacterium]MCW5583533.1 carboxylesterase [Gammaproteobacteria bacterium]
MNKETRLSCVEIEPANTAKRSILWLHGLGADGNDFAPIVPELNLPSSAAVRFVFPHAPIIPVSINNGYPMRAWYDIYHLSIDSRVDKVGIAQSVISIQQLIEREVSRGIPTHNIFLAGFSQGAVIALTTALCYSHPLAGVIALSGYLPAASETLENANPANHQIPIFLAHGTEDPIVPFTLGNATYAIVKQASYPVTWYSYPMPHSVCTAEIRDLSAWLNGIIKKQEDCSLS